MSKPATTRRLSRHLRTEQTEEQYHSPDPHAGCEDAPCDDCHRRAVVDYSRRAEVAHA